MFEKNEFLRNISFSAHLLSSLKVVNSRNNQKCHDSVLCISLLSLSSQILILVTTLGTHYSSSSCQQNQNYLHDLFQLQSLNDLQTVMFHLIFADFLVNILSTTSHRKSAKHTRKSHSYCPVDTRRRFNVQKTSIRRR